MDSRIIENSVVQVNENGDIDWVGCLVQVSEVKSFGVQGWVQVPKSGKTFIRIKFSEIDYIGQAVMA